jgi:hypothetical protein
MLEHVINENQAFQISGSYLGKSGYLALMETQISDPLNISVRGYRFQAEYKFYLKGLLRDIETPEGLYFAPAYSYSHAKFINRYNAGLNEYLSMTYTYYGLKCGYQIIDNNLAIDIFLGGGYRENIWVDYMQNTSTVVDEEEYTIYPGHFKILFGFNAGWAFSQ